ncbi:SAG-related sequence SRS54 [Toxoplasma gondii RUB]|uniref:SAG-related sequence SRS54 n=2 Tax=Toxoplasma gondii TaxID=5811 RepID=A0A086MBW0_TOXGO|nr:SAG-related sequence SRS54 [Toxoplasma gondii p89]KFG66378.1 SAG-related sequence SRS54 [Toxoplasma gondii RUB]
MASVARCVVPVPSDLVPRREMQPTQGWRVKRAFPLISGVGLTLVFIQIASGLFNAAPVIVIAGAEGQTSTTLACAEDAQHSKISCTCTPGTVEKRTPATAVTHEVTVSGNKSELQLECKTNFNFVPEDDTGKKVCPPGKEICDCKNESHCVPIDPFFTGTTTTLAWKRVGTSKRENSDTKSLTIPAENFPYVDGKFLVGCTGSSESPAPCALTVNIEARASVTNDHTVTCAYGNKSNKEHQAITIKPSQNSFTLVCGDKGEILPKNYVTTYCATQAGQHASDDCKGDYKSILPAYTEKWWKENPTGSFVFEIPPGDFPEVPVNLTLSCQQKTTRQSSIRDTDSNASDKPSVCTVDVTIENGPNSSASATGFLSLTMGSFAAVTALTYTA